MKNDDSVQKFKELSEKMKSEDYESRREIKDIVLVVLKVILYICVGFGWMMLMLLIISFISLGFIHMNIKHMVIASVIFAVLCGGYCIWGLIHHRKK